MTERVREAFRPCIDLHDGAVKQIVGGTLQDSDAGAGMADGVVENFVSEKPPAFYSALCAPSPPARAGLELARHHAPNFGFAAPRWALSLTAYTLPGVRET